MATSRGRSVLMLRRFGASRWRRRALAGLTATLSVLILTGCPGVPPPERLAFDTDARILRGSFVGTVDTRVVPFSMALAGDASLLVASWRDSVEFWDVETSRRIATVATPTDGFTSVSGLSVDRSGSLVAGLLEGTVLLWDAQSGTLVREFDSGDRLGSCLYCGVYEAALSPAGDLLAAGGMAPRVLLVDTGTGAVVRELATVGDRAGLVAFSADGALLASASHVSNTRYALRVWETDTYGVVFEREGTVDPSRVARFAFSADGRRFAVDSATTLEVFDLAGGVSVLPYQASVVGWSWLQALSADGAHAAIAQAADHGGDLSIVDVATGSTIASFTADLRDRAAWGADGRYLIAGPTLVGATDFAVVHNYTIGQLFGLELDATPEFVSSRTYTVSGVISIDGGVGIDFSGIVDGGEAQRYVQPQARPPTPATLEVELHGHPWRLHAQQVPSHDYFHEPGEWWGFVTDSALGEDDQVWVPLRLWRAR